MTCGDVQSSVRYTDLTVVLQEIPGEISLALTITGCQLRCEGCHSRHTWNKHKGDLLTPEVFVSLLDKYDGMITCVVFFGGEWYEAELITLLQIAKTRNLKTALYTGLDDVSQQLKDHLTFLKVGPYQKQNGGLAYPGTNQRLFVIATGESLNTHLQQ